MLKVDGLSVPIVRKCMRSSRLVCPLCRVAINRGSVGVKVRVRAYVEGELGYVLGWAHDGCIEAAEPTLFESPTS